MGQELISAETGRRSPSATLLFRIAPCGCPYHERHGGIGFLIQGPVRLPRWRDATLLHRRPGDDIEIAIGHGVTSSLLRPLHVWRHFGIEKLKHESRLGRAASVDERRCAILGRQSVPAVPKSRNRGWRSGCHDAHIMCASTPTQGEARDWAISTAESAPAHQRRRATPRWSVSACGMRSEPVPNPTLIGLRGAIFTRRRPHWPPRAASTKPKASYPSWRS